jgi:hypothetical protein
VTEQEEQEEQEEQDDSPRLALKVFLINDRVIKKPANKSEQAQFEIEAIGSFLINDRTL